MNLHAVLKRAERFATDNSPVILTAVGVAGTVMTAFLAGKASFKAAELIREEQDVLDAQAKSTDLTLREKAELVWTLYIPPVATGALTVASIIGANRIGSRRAAAVAAAYSLSERAFEEYRAKVGEKLGERKERAVRDEIAQERVTKNPPDTSVMMLGNGKVICLDMYTDRYWKSSMEEIKAGMNRVNYIINNDGYATLTDYYNAVGLPRVPFSDEVGWSSEDQLDLQITGAITPEGEPCLAVSFRSDPVHNYQRFH